MTTETISTWDRYQGNPATVYEHHFVPTIGQPFAAPVVEATAPQPGEQVLDVACGTGIVARLAARSVGDHGLVVGIDGHPGMLAVARSIDPRIDWRLASAEGLPLDDDSVHVVLCSLGLQFFTDRLRALEEMRRVVRPGGRVAIATAGPTPELFEVLRDVLAEHLGDHVAGFVDAVFAIDDTDHLRELMTTAGHNDVETTRRRIPLQLDPPADFFWQYLLGTPLAQHVAELADDQRTELEHTIVERWRPFTTASGVAVDVDMVLGTATAHT